MASVNRAKDLSAIALSSGPVWARTIPRGPRRSDVGERRRRLAQGLVPGPREPSLRAASGERPLLVPLAARQLVVDLEPIAVGIREVDADGNRVVGDANGHTLVVQAPIDLREVVEARHPPGHVVQTHLGLLRPGDVVRVAGVTRKEGRAQPLGAGMIERILGVEAEDLRIPSVRPLGVAHEDVDVVQGHRLIAHLSLSLPTGGSPSAYG